MTADDFVYGFHRAVDPATACPSVAALLPILNAGEISSGREKDLSKLGMTALDPQTLRITLARPTPWLLDLLTDQTAMPVPRQAIEKWGDRWTQPEHMVTNGPFTLKKWVPLDEIDLMRNPHFHDAAAVKIDEVDDVLADDSSAALKRYETGELDVIRVPGKEDLPRLKQERPEELRSDPMLSTSAFVFNMDGPLGADPRIRQALSMVIDREVLENKVARRGQIPAYSYIPPGIPNYSMQRPDWADRPMSERIAMAKKLLAEAGTPVPVKIHLLSPKLDFVQLYTRAIIAMWHTALGIEAEEEAMETRIYSGRLTHRDFEIAFIQWNGSYPDAQDMLSDLGTVGGGYNVGNYRNPKYDSLLDQSSSAASPAERTTMLQSAEKLMLQDQPVIPFNFVVAQRLVNRRVRGIENSAIGIHPSRFLSIAEQD